MSWFEASIFPRRYNRQTPHIIVTASLRQGQLKDPCTKKDPLSDQTQITTHSEDLLSISEAGIFQLSFKSNLPTTSLCNSISIYLGKIDLKHYIVVLNIADVTKRIFYIILCVFTFSCRTEETTAFWFKNEKNKRTGNITHATNNLVLSLSSIISTNQVHQGMNTNLGFRSTNEKKVTIDSISIIIDIQNEQVTPVISKSFAKSTAIEYPITLEANEFDQYSILLLNQEDYEIGIGDSVNLKINIYQTEQQEKTVYSLEVKKYFETWKYTTMP